MQLTDADARLITGYAKRRFGEAGEEIAQNAALRLLQDTNYTEQGKRNSYILRAVHMAGASYYQGDWHSNNTEVLDESDHEPWMVYQDHGADYGDEVHTAFAALSDQFRGVAELRYMRDMSCKQIAEALGIPVGTALSRVSRARDRLTSSLSGYAKTEYRINASRTIGYRHFSTTGQRRRPLGAGVRRSA
jgi:RNA polymerase sigma-70 factor (ECF subfamily)